MGVASKAQGLDAADAAETTDPSVTAVGEPALVKTEAPEITRGTVLAGRYQVEAVIGRGGSGIVLRAFDRVAQAPVAVKILKPELAGDPRWIDRFSRELRLARRIHHPNVCRVFDIAQADGHWFITMELASGGTLRDQLGEKAKLRSIDEKLTDLRAVIAGLVAIHEAGIVHRDIKPDNFLRMNGGRLVLSDFGLATNPSEASTVSIMVGTPSYMAPEVVMGQQATFPSDVWSLGVVLHELLFGVRPEWTRGVAGTFVIRKFERGELTAKERALISFIEECLHTDPSVRPQNAIDARVHCERLLAGQKIGSSRRRRTRTRWLWPAIVSLGALAVGLGGGHWWRRASASSSPGATIRAPSFVGFPDDLTKTSTAIASFEGHIHCMDWLAPDQTLRVIEGSPRRAFDIDVATGDATPDPLDAATFAAGCPRRSKRGELLFEAFDGNGRTQILLAPSESQISRAKVVVHGSEPLWLPSGDEFLYSADDSHAALFSLPVMSTNIVAEAADDAGLLVGKNVSADGRAIVLRYFDVAQKRHVVIHSLPSLAVEHRATFDKAAMDVSFSRADRLAFTTESEAGNVLAELDLRSDEARFLGGIPGRDIGLPTPGSNRLAVTSTLYQSDVWRQEGGVRTAQLTHDGRSFYPDLSPTGDLLVEHLGLDGKARIRLFPKEGGSRDVSAGPEDMTPSFLPDGSGWLYVDGLRRVIRRCNLAADCIDVSVQADFPFVPVASADGSLIAYVTGVDRERLKVVTRSGDVRELGPARAQCRPYWTSDNHLWVLQGSDQSPNWAELNVATGERLHTLPVDEPVGSPRHGCGLRRAPPGALLAPGAAAWDSESSQVRLLNR